MEHRNQWKQVSLKALEFFTEIETNINADLNMTTTKKNDANSTKRSQQKN